MWTYFKILFALIIFCYSDSFSQDKKYQDLFFSSYLDSVYTHNENLKVLKYRYQNSLIESKAISENLKPTLYLNLFNALQFGKSIDPSSNNFVDVSLMAIRPQIIGDMPLSSFGKASQLKRVTEYETMTILDEIEIEKSKLILNALNEFLTLYYYQKQKIVLETFIANSKEVMGIVTEGYKEGKYSKLILLQVEARFKNDSIAILELETRNRNLQNKIRLNFSKPDDTNFSVKLDEWILNLIKKFDSSSFLNNSIDRDNNFVSKFYWNKASQTDAKIKQMENERKPSLSFVYSISSIYAGVLTPKSRDTWINDFSNQMSINFNQIAGFNFSIPILSRTSLKNNIKRLELEKSYWIENYRLANSSYRLEYLNAIRNCIDAKGYYNKLSYIYNLQYETIDLARISLKLGKGTLLDYYTLENDYRNSRIKLEAAYVDLLYKTLLLHELYFKE